MNKMKKKVVLFFPKINTYDKFHWFPFVNLMLGANLKADGFEVVSIDQRVQKDWKSILLKNSQDAVYVGISAMTGYQIKGALEASELIKSKFKTKVVWGGRHCTLIPEQTLINNNIDIVVIGNGENVAVNIANSIYNDKNLNEVEGIMYKDIKKRMVRTQHNANRIREKQKYDFNLININDYINPETKAMSYFSSFGCPGRCGFCTNAYFKEKWIPLNTEIVINDVEYLVNNYGFKVMFFQDSNFFNSLKRVKQIAQGFIDRNIQIKWKTSARIDRLCRTSEEDLNLLVKSGLCSLFIGVESGSQRMLDVMSKDTKVEQIYEVFKKLNAFDIEVHSSLIFGLPCDSLEALDKTIKLINDLKSINKKAKFQTCFFTPYPGTPLYDMACNKGYKPPTNLKEWSDVEDQTVFKLGPWIDDRIKKEYKDKFEKAFLESYSSDFKELSKDG